MSSGDPVCSDHALHPVGHHDLMSFDSQFPALVWFGRFFTHDGYGSAAQMHVAALKAEGVPVVGVDIGSRQVVGSVPDNFVRITETGNALQISPHSSEQRLTAIVHDRPDHFAKFNATGRSRLIGYSYWETTTLPSGWAGALSSMDRVWTSSEFNKDSFAASGVPDWMIDTLGHPVDQTLIEVSKSGGNHRSRWPEQTVFLSVVSSTVGRRDLAMLFEAYASAFDETDDVALVLKVPAKGAGKLGQTIEQVMATLPARSSGRWPRVYTIASTLSREQLVRLHASVDCYVSCERGDGFDLPSMDSMVLGVPVIATDFGASSTFLQSDDCYLIETSTTMVRCDDALVASHPLYSGQFWPYVDPSAIAEKMKAVADDPVDRARRGAHARDRLRARFEQSVVVRQVTDLVAAGTEVDYRSNDQAVVTLSERADQWPVPAEAYTVAAHPKLAEARLAAMLTDDALLRPRDPRRFSNAYKRASAYATSTPAISGSPTRDAISSVMSARSPIEKALAFRRLRSRAESLADPFGGRDGLRERLKAADDYLTSITSQSSAFAPAESERLRRQIWGNYGPFKSPADDLQRLAKLRNRHAGERCFILGNGPSLVNCDLSLLAGEYTFGVNKIYLLFPRIEWRPTYFTLLDWKMGEGIRDDLHHLEGITKFFPERFRGVLPDSDETFWYWPRAVGTHVDDQFESDMVRGIPSRGTVLVTAIQQAVHLGFKDIYLIGTDASYTIPETVIQSGPDRFNTGIKLNLESTADDDPNHFAPTYFGKGSHWHDPNVSEMRRMFRMMRKGVERNGGRLLNASVGGELEELERVDYRSLF